MTVIITLKSFHKIIMEDFKFIHPEKESIIVKGLTRSWPDKALVESIDKIPIKEIQEIKFQ